MPTTRLLRRWLGALLLCLLAPTLFAGTAYHPRSDFYGNGTSDLVWRNSTTGQVFMMPMSGGVVQPGTVFWTEPNPAWQIVGTGDFDGDGKADLLWWNSSTGQVYQMLMNGSTAKSSGLIYTEPDTAWTIQAVADFDGDGRADILWRNSSTGAVYLMPMNGATVLPGTIIWTEPDPAWQIVGTGDFDGDGKADILWWNSATGQVYQMLMNGTTIKSSGLIYTEPDTAWKIVGTGDFNGDGKVDILWRNATTGAVYLMPMNGATVLPGSIIWTEPNMAWQILAIGDFDCDGKDDIVWRNSNTGQVFQMLMNGGAVKASGLIYTEPTTAWTIAATSAKTIAYTVSVNVGAGTTATPLTQQVLSGQTATLNVGLLSGYNTLVVTGGGGTVNGSTYTTGPITANTTITTSATRSSCLVTFVLGEGVTSGVSSWVVQPGEPASVWITALGGYGVPVARITHGSGTAVITSPSGGIGNDYICNYTATTDLEITFSAPLAIYYTVDAIVGTGTMAMPSIQQVLSGQTVTLTVGLLSGYSNLMVTGGGGTLKGSTYTTGPITANTTITTSASPLTFTVSTISGTGTTISPASTTVQYGQTATFTLGLLPGYASPTISGLGGTRNGLTFTTEPVMADTTITSNAIAFTTVPRTSRVIAFVVEDLAQVALGMQLGLFMDAVVADTPGSSASLIVVSNADAPASIRNQLQAIPNLWGAFLIGNVPKIGWHYTDQAGQDHFTPVDFYYRNLTYPFQQPDARSILYVDDVFRDPSPDPRMRGGIWTSRIIASAPDRYGEIVAYIEKNLQLRDSSNWLRKFDLFTPINLGVTEYTPLKNVFLDHPLYTSSEVTHLDAQGNTSEFMADAVKTAWCQPGEFSCYSGHGNALGIYPEGSLSTAPVSFLGSDVATWPIKTKVVEMRSCIVGDFNVSDFFLSKLVSAGDTLLVSGPSDELWTNADEFALRSFFQYRLLGYGAAWGDADPIDHPLLHYFGDPTIAFSRTVVGPQPRLVIDQTRLEQPSVIRSIVLPDSVNDAETTWSMMLRNAGDADLVLDLAAGTDAFGLDGRFLVGNGGGMTPAFQGNWNTPGDGQVTWYLIGNAPGRYGVWRMTLKPGDSQTLTFTFTSATILRADGSSYRARGLHTARYQIYTNDPGLTRLTFELSGLAR